MLTVNEKELYIALIVELAKWAGGQKGIPQSYAGTERDRASWALVDAGFHELTDKDGVAWDGETGLPCHNPKYSRDNIEQLFETGILNYKADIHTLLNACIDVSAYGNTDEYIDSSIEEFSVPDRYRDLLELLVVCEYANKADNDKFSWTNKIGPVFFESGDWIANTIEETKKIREQWLNSNTRRLDVMIDTMPPRIKKKLGTGTILTFGRVIASYWYNEKWNFRSRLRNKEFATIDIELAKNLIQRIEDRAANGTQFAN